MRKMSTNALCRDILDMVDKRRENVDSRIDRIRYYYGKFNSMEKPDDTVAMAKYQEDSEAYLETIHAHQTEALKLLCESLKLGKILTSLMEEPTYAESESGRDFRHSAPQGKRDYIDESLQIRSQRIEEDSESNGNDHG